MWSNFGVKLNYIVILEKLCNNSTLLMELFMICGQLQDLLRNIYSVFVCVYELLWVELTYCMKHEVSHK